MQYCTSSSDSQASAVAACNQQWSAGKTADLTGSVGTLAITSASEHKLTHVVVGQA